MHMQLHRVMLEELPQRNQRLGMLSMKFVSNIAKLMCVHVVESSELETTPLVVDTVFPVKVEPATPVVVVPTSLVVEAASLVAVKVVLAEAAPVVASPEVPVVGGTEDVGWCQEY